MKPHVQCKTKDGCRGDTAPVGDAANGTERDFVRMLDHVAGNGCQARAAPASATRQTVAQLGQIARWPVGDRTAFDVAQGRLSVHSRSRHASNPFLRWRRQGARLPRVSCSSNLAAHLKRRGRIQARRGNPTPPENATWIGKIIPLLTYFGTFVTLRQAISGISAGSSGR
jgi:hypothetical protein